MRATEVSVLLHVITTITTTTTMITIVDLQHAKNTSKIKVRGGAGV